MKAVQIRRTLARQNSDAFQSDLAASLDNQAMLLTELGSPEDGLLLEEEAVEIRRTLARQNPDAFQSDLAVSLNNLAILLTGLSKTQEALFKAREAVEIHRKLLQQDQIAFQSNLAVSLGVLAQVFADMEDYTNATTVLLDAIQTLEPQFTQFPRSFESLMRDLVQRYLDSAGRAQTRTDDKLLLSIRRSLSTFE
jgi:tetratricopeptide (TPR) repeat protein